LFWWVENSSILFVESSAIDLVAELFILSKLYETYNNAVSKECLILKQKYNR